MPVWSDCHKHNISEGPSEARMHTIIIDGKHLCLATATLVSMAHGCSSNQKTEPKKGASSDAHPVSLCKPGILYELTPTEHAHWCYTVQLTSK